MDMKKLCYKLYTVTKILIKLKRKNLIRFSSQSTKAMPTRLNDYILGRTLGSGVSCKVKLAKNEAGTRFAIKILNNNADFDELIQTEV